MKPVVLKTFDNYFQANIFLSKLQAAGVPCRLLDENFVTTIPFLSNMIGGIKLVVHQDDVEKAKELLEQFEKTPEEKLHCPKCGSENYVELTQPASSDSKSIIYRLSDDYPLDTTIGYRCFDCDFTISFDEEGEITMGPVNKKVIAVIPARYASTRFPYKLMQPLGNKTVIRQTHDNVLATGLFDEVWVVTDHQSIYNEISGNGGKTIMSKKEHESGSDRIAEAIEKMDVQVIVNVQGDEPFVNKTALANLVNQFTDGKVKVASLMKKFTDPYLVEDPNYVKVLTDKNNDALYFSRSVIPFNRDRLDEVPYYEHIGVYAYTKDALIQFTKWEAAPPENMEKLEQLRYLYNGVKIRMVETETSSVKIDVPADLAIAEEYWKHHFNS